MPSKNREIFHKKKIVQKQRARDTHKKQKYIVLIWESKRQV